MTKFDSIPTNILPGIESPEVTKRKYSFLFALLEGELDGVDTNISPTLLDFQGLHSDATDADLVNWVVKVTGIRPEVFTEGAGLPDNQREYQRLDYAYQMGKVFLSDVLKYSTKEIDIGPSSLATKQDVLDLLRRTKLVGGVSGLSRAVTYCRLVKATIVAHEVLKSEARQLKQMTKDFEKALVAPITKENNIKSPLVLLRHGEEGEKYFYAKSDGSVKGKLNSRGKKIESVMLRFITRPEASADIALKDGVGVRITIEKKQAMNLLPILCEWLLREMGVDFLNIGNKAFLSTKQVQALQEKLSETLSVNQFNLTDTKSSDTSMGNFEALVLVGALPQLESSDSSISPHIRQFEIQLVAPGNQNEEGKMDHAIYHIVKCVTARTRLDGRCPEPVFLELVNEASRKTGKSSATIIDYLLGEKDNENLSVVKVRKQTKKGKEFFYVAEPVYSRWRNLGLVDAGVVEDINKASGPRSKKRK